jgi:hypothetical protein
MAEGWLHPSLWVTDDTDDIDQELWVAVHNDGQMRYQGSRVEYFRIEGNSLSMKSEEN